MSTTTAQSTKRAKSQQKTRDALVKAGSSLIAQNGYSGASVRDIASLAGYTQGAFYSNFQSKDDLVFEIMRIQFRNAYASISLLEYKHPLSPEALAQEAAHWSQNICGSDEKALLFTEINMHAIRDEKFALTYDRLFEEHALKMTVELETIAHASQLTLCAPAEQIAKGMLALTRGLMLMMSREKKPVAFDILRLFLTAVLEKPLGSKPDVKD